MELLEGCFRIMYTGRANLWLPCSSQALLALSGPPIAICLGHESGMSRTELVRAGQVHVQKEAPITKSTSKEPSLRREIPVSASVGDLVSLGKRAKRNDLALHGRHVGSTTCTVQWRGMGLLF